MNASYRAAQGQSATHTGYVMQSLPLYLKLTRSGNTFSGFYSTDGVKYVSIPGSTQTFALPSVLLAGLSITSHASGTIGSATLQGVGL